MSCTTTPTTKSTLPDGQHLHRRGRFHRFFQYLSLFSFSMLGICISGNLAMTFVFWELVGICSYFLIGFYIERHSASTAANKAFIVNRVGDFGMLIGLMAILDDARHVQLWRHDGCRRHRSSQASSANCTSPKTITTSRRPMA